MPLTTQEVEALKKITSPSVANAIETFKVRPREHGNVSSAIRALFRLGVEQMSQGAAPSAIETFTTIIQKKPDFAEGWNKRATIYYLVGEYEKSLRDCDEVVKRNPQHWGVLAGYGQIYLALDKPELALDYFQRALKVNPNLQRVEAAVAELKRLIIEKRKGTI